MNLALIYLGVFYLAANGAVVLSDSQDEAAIDQKQEDIYTKTVATYADSLKALPELVSSLSKTCKLPAGLQPGENIARALFEVSPAILRLKASLGECLSEVNSKVEEAFENCDSSISELIKPQILEVEREIESSLGTEEKGAETFKQYLILLCIIFENINHILDKGVTSPEQAVIIKLIIFLKVNNLDENGIINQLNSLGNSTDEPINELSDQIKNQLLALCSLYGSLIDVTKNRIPMEDALIKCLIELINGLSDKIIIDIWNVIQNQIKNWEEVQQPNWYVTFINCIRNVTENPTNKIQQAFNDVIQNINVDDLDKIDPDALTKNLDNYAKQSVKTFLAKIQIVMKYRAILSLDSSSVRKDTLNYIINVMKADFTLLNVQWESIIIQLSETLSQKSKDGMTELDFREILNEFIKKCNREQNWIISLRNLALILSPKGYLTIDTIVKRLTDFIPKCMQSIQDDIIYRLNVILNGIGGIGIASAKVYKDTRQKISTLLNEVSSQTLKLLGNRVYTLLADLKSDNIIHLINSLNTSKDKTTQIFDAALCQLLLDIISIEEMNSKSKQHIEFAIEMIHSLAKNVLTLTQSVINGKLCQILIKLDQLSYKGLLTIIQLKSEFTLFIPNLKVLILSLTDKINNMYYQWEIYIKVIKSHTIEDIVKPFLKEAISNIQSTNLKSLEDIKDKLSQSGSPLNYNWLNTLPENLQNSFSPPVTSLTNSLNKCVQRINDQLSTSMKDLNISEALKDINSSDKVSLECLFKSLALVVNSINSSQDSVETYKNISNVINERSKNVFYLYTTLMDSRINEIVCDLSNNILNNNLDLPQLYKICNEEVLTKVVYILYIFFDTALPQMERMCWEALPTTVNVVSLNEIILKYQPNIFEILCEKIIVAVNNCKDPKELYNISDTVVDDNLNSAIDAIINLHNLISKESSLANIEDCIEQSFSQDSNNLKDLVVEKITDLMNKIISQEGVENNAVIKAKQIISLELVYLRNFRYYLKVTIPAILNKYLISLILNTDAFDDVSNKLTTEIQECINYCIKEVEGQVKHANVFINSLRIFKNADLAVDSFIECIKGLGNAMIERSKSVINEHISELQSNQPNTFDQVWASSTVAELKEKLSVTTEKGDLTKILEELSNVEITDLTLDNFDDMIDAKLDKLPTDIKAICSSFLKSLTRLLIASKGSHSEGATFLASIIQSSSPICQIIFDMCSYSIQKGTSKLEVTFIQLIQDNSCTITSVINEMENVSNKLSDDINAGIYYITSFGQIVPKICLSKDKDLHNIPSELAKITCQTYQDLSGCEDICLSKIIKDLPVITNNGTLINIYNNIKADIDEKYKLHIKIQQAFDEVQRNLSTNLNDISGVISQIFDKIDCPIAFFIKRAFKTCTSQLIALKGLNAVSEYTDLIKCMKNIFTNVLIKFISSLSDLNAIFFATQIKNINLTKDLLSQALNKLKQDIYDGVIDYKQSQLDLMESIVWFLVNNFSNPKYVIGDIADSIQEIVQQAKSKVSVIISKYLDPQSGQLTISMIQQSIKTIESTYPTVLDSEQKGITDSLEQFDSNLTIPLIKVFDNSNIKSTTIGRCLLNSTTLVIAEVGYGNDGVEVIRDEKNIINQLISLIFKIFNYKIQQCTNELKNELLLANTPDVVKAALTKYLDKVNQSKDEAIQCINVITSVVTVVSNKTPNTIDSNALVSAFYPLTIAFAKTISIFTKGLIHTEITKLLNVKVINLEQLIQVVNNVKQGKTSFINTIPNKIINDFNKLTNGSDLCDVFYKLQNACDDFGDPSKSVLTSIVFNIVSAVIKIYGLGQDAVKHCQISLNPIYIGMQNVLNSNDNYLDNALNNIVVEQGQDIDTEGLTPQGLEQLLDDQNTAVCSSFPLFVNVQLQQLGIIEVNIVNIQYSQELVDENFDWVAKYISALASCIIQTNNQTTQDIIQDNLDFNINLVSLIQSKLNDNILKKFGYILTLVPNILQESQVIQGNAFNTDLIDLSYQDLDEDVKTLLQSSLNQIINMILTTKGKGSDAVEIYERATNCLIAFCQIISVAAKQQLVGVIQEASSELTELQLDNKLDKSSLEQTLDLIPGRIDTAFNSVGIYFSTGLKTVIAALRLCKI